MANNIHLLYQTKWHLQLAFCFNLLYNLYKEKEWIHLANKRLLEQLKNEILQAVQDWDDGKCVSVSEFDWGLPLHIAENSSNNYQADEHTWTELKIHKLVTLQLKSIYSYISNNLFNELASFRLKGFIEDRFNTISNHPKIGAAITSRFDNVATNFTDIRKLNVKNYILLYVYRKDSGDALVTHTFHQTQDYGRLFQN